MAKTEHRSYITRNQFFTSEYIIHQAISQQLVGDYLQSFAVISAYTENTEKLKVSPQLVLLGTKALLKLQENVQAFTFLSDFVDNEYFEMYKKSYPLLETQLTLVYLDLFMTLTRFYDDQYLSFIINDKEALIQYKEVFIKFLNCDATSQADSPLYQKLQKRFETIQSFLVLQLKLKIVLNEKTGIFEEFIKDCVHFSPILLHWLVQVRLAYMIRSEFKDLSQLALLRQTYELYLQSEAYYTQKGIKFVLLGTEEEHSRIVVELQLRYLAYLHKGESFDDFFTDVITILEGLNGFDLIHELQPHFFRILLLAIQRMKIDQQKYIQHIHFFIQIVELYYTILVKRSIEGYYMEGQLPEFFNTVKNHLRNFQHYRQRMQKIDIFTHIYECDPDTVVVGADMGDLPLTQNKKLIDLLNFDALTLIDYSDITKTSLYDLDNLQTRMIKFNTEQLTQQVDTAICYIAARRISAEFHLQLGTNYLKYNASAGALDAFTRSVLCFPLKIAFGAIAKILQRMGDQKGSSKVLGLSAGLGIEAEMEKYTTTADIADM